MLLYESSAVTSVAASDNCINNYKAVPALALVFPFSAERMFFTYTKTSFAFLALVELEESATVTNPERSVNVFSERSSGNLSLYSTHFPPISNLPVSQLHLSSTGALPDLH